MVTNRMRPIHPGEQLRDEFDEIGSSARTLDRSLRVPTNRITEVLCEKPGHFGGYGLAAGAIFRDDDGTIVSRTWDFGDSNGSTQQAPEHSYAPSGSYTVEFTVTDDDGATGDVTRIVNVTPATSL
jgi:uncharacterized membrane protein